jgi:hypothetical protein
MASWLNVPAGFLAFILESDYLKVFNFCCWSEFNIVYSNIYGIYTIAFYCHEELITASLFCNANMCIGFKYCLQDIY